MILKRLGKIDYSLLYIVLFLLIAGIVILTSVSASFSQEKSGSSYSFLFHQIIFGLIPGLFLGFLAFRAPINFFKKWAPLLFGINLIFMVLIFIPGIGSEVFGASRWIGLGPLSFQPSEFLKLTFILYLSLWLANRLEKEKLISKVKSKKEDKPLFTLTNLEEQTLIPFLAIIGTVGLLLILQPDISTLGVIVLVSFLIYFLAGTPIKHSVMIILGGITVLATLIKLAPYRTQRLAVFLNPEIDPMGLGYQIKQALIAVGSGGIMGLGLGMSRQKLGFLPQPMADSIFAIFAEEAGFIGSFILVSLFIAFAWKGFNISKRSSDKFCQFVGIGITSWIVIQGFVNMGSMLGILPLTGIPLPFISYGGTHIIVELVGVGILLNISKNK